MLSCGFVAWSGNETCKKCGSPHAQVPPFNPQQGYSHNYGQSHPHRQLKKGLAIFSLVLGIFNLFTLGLIGVGAIIGIVVAIVALSKIKHNPAVYGGKELATAGLVTSIISVAIIVPVGIMPPSRFPTSWRRAGRPMRQLRSRRSERFTRQRLPIRVPTKRYGSLEELIADPLIHPDLASGSRYGYRFTVAVSIDEVQNRSVFSAVGVPAVYPSSGRRSFFVDETGVIRGADSHGGEATKYDAPLDFDSYDYSSAPRRRNYEPAPDTKAGDSNLSR